MRPQDLSALQRLAVADAVRRALRAQGFTVTTSTALPSLYVRHPWRDRAATVEVAPTRYARAYVVIAGRWRFPITADGCNTAGVVERAAETCGPVKTAHAYAAHRSGEAPHDAAACRWCRDAEAEALSEDARQDAQGGA